MQAAARIALWVARACSCSGAAVGAVETVAAVLGLLLAVLLLGATVGPRERRVRREAPWPAGHAAKLAELAAGQAAALGASAALLVARARLVWAMRCVAVRVCAGIGGVECQAGGVQRVREGRTRAHTC